MRFSWLSLQARLLIIKSISLAYRTVPFKKTFLSVAGHAAGAAYVAAHIARLGRLEAYRKGVAPETGLFRFALKYYSTYARIYLLSHLIYDDTGSLGSYVSVEGSDAVKRAMQEGRGVIILGCHYGPPVMMPVLRELCGIPVRVVTGERVHFNVTAALKPLLTPKMRYISPEEVFRAGKDTAKVIRHLHGGGALYILNDLNSSGPGVTAVDFLGRKINFSNFPFKASLKYSVPLFFTILRDDGPEHYNLEFIPFDDSLGVEGGLKSYMSLVASQIKTSPYKWTLGNDFSSWPEAAA